MKMKKIYALLSIMLISLFLCSCGSEEDKAYKAIKSDFDKNEMEAVVNAVDEFKEVYPESKYIEGLEEMVKSAEKYLADNFEPVELKYYKDYMGVLDFGAYAGIEVFKTDIDDKGGVYTYIDAKDYMLIPYIQELKNQGFQENKQVNAIFNALEVDITDTIYLKNSQYNIGVMYSDYVLLVQIY